MTPPSAGAQVRLDMHASAMTATVTGPERNWPALR
ncbi:hypothetical protein STAFG_8490 [Streptomyces afghaniensis 772]|uniref:Uncharacterized protein n=1 Tax=Streptomyces afghaniensis 772 TaxID=1283301 RepID=S4N9K6_9ACTN|nr:hypothetical protein STAFG_8490 [Streptomyces afghaniensis 772]